MKARKKKKKHEKEKLIILWRHQETEKSTGQNLKKCLEDREQEEICSLKKEKSSSPVNAYFLPQSH